MRWRRSHHACDRSAISSTNLNDSCSCRCRPCVYLTLTSHLSRGCICMAADRRPCIHTPLTSWKKTCRKAEAPGSTRLRLRAHADGRPALRCLLACMAGCVPSSSSCPFAGHALQAAAGTSADCAAAFFELPTPPFNHRTTYIIALPSEKQRPDTKCFSPSLARTAPDQSHYHIPCVMCPCDWIPHTYVYTCRLPPAWPAGYVRSQLPMQEN